MKAFLLLVMLVVSVFACAPDVSQSACELGRSAACVCSSGAAGAQECGPSGVWAPCVCAAPGDASQPDAAEVSAVDASAPADAADDAVRVDAAPDVADAQTAPADAAADVAPDLGIYDAPGVCLVPGMVPCGPDPADCVYLSDGRGLPARSCGACGVNCASGQMCSEGRCINPCPPGRIYCIGNLDLAVSCIDPMRSNDNCGACRVVCGSPMVCEGGRCVR